MDAFGDDGDGAIGEALGGGEPGGADGFRRGAAAGAGDAGGGHGIVGVEGAEAISRTHCSLTAPNSANVSGRTPKTFIFTSLE